MRISIFTNTYTPAVNGVVTSIKNFCNGLKAYGHQTAILAPDYSHEETPNEKDVFRIPSIDLTEIIDAALPLPSKIMVDPIMKGLSPDLIHSQHPIVMGNLATSYAQEFAIPLVFTFHTRYAEYAREYFPLDTEIPGKIAEQVIESYLENCAHVIAPTRHIKELINTYGLDIPVTVIPTPINLAMYKNVDEGKVRSECSVDDDDLLLYVGRISPEKNVKFLLDAFKLIHQRKSGVKLMLVGQGPQADDLEKYSIENRLSDNVLFVGSVTHEDIPAYMKAADLFVFPSITETQGLVLIEAMAAATPVIGVDAPAQRDILAKGGGIISNLDPRDFSEAVLSLLDDDAHKGKLAEEALKNSSVYDIPSCTEQLLEVYKAVL
jgi:glycosyltransferase involved in cell wall biosynthesis